MLESITQRLSSIEASQKQTTERLDKMEEEKKSSLDEILGLLRGRTVASTSAADQGPSHSAQSSSDLLPRLENIPPADRQEEDNNKDSDTQEESKSPVFTNRLVTKRKASSDNEDSSSEAKRQKIKHKRTKSSTPAERQK